MQQPPEHHAKRNHPTATPQKKMLVVLRTARPLVVPRGTQRRLLSVSVGAVAGGCVVTRASHARMLEAAPPPPPATAILAQRRRAGADLDDDANVLQHLARACFRLARIVETSIRLGALATPLVLAVRGTVWKSSFTMLSHVAASARWRGVSTPSPRRCSRNNLCSMALKSAKSAKFRRLAAMASPADAREMNKTPRAGPPPPLRRGPLVALLPLGDARGGADGRQARAVGLVARGPLPARVLRPLRPFARPGAGARVARHGARPRGVARARLARRARRRRGARRHGLRRPGALGGTRRRLFSPGSRRRESQQHWGRGDGARAGYKRRSSRKT